MAFDYKKEFSEFYLPAKKPSIIKIPAMNFVAVSGKGNPNEEGGFERKWNNLSEFRKTVRKFILITVVFLGLFAEKATAQSNKIIKFDVYEGKNLEAGKKSYALSFILQDTENTLKDKQIEAIMAKLQKTFEEKFAAKLR